MVAQLTPVGAGRRIIIDRAVVVVGRSPDCDAVLDCSSRISRMHCALIQVDSDYFIRDLGSLNGVRVNGSRISRELRLNDGCQVAIGDLQFLFHENPSVNPAPATESRNQVVPPATSERKYPVFIDESRNGMADDVIDVDESDVEIIDDVELLDDVEIVDDVELVDEGENEAQAESFRRKNGPVVPSADVIEIVEDVEILDDDILDDDLIIEIDDFPEDNGKRPPRRSP
jgi:pSer/pThr/pTyr-binding forkhead associated (FHA) protein